MDRLSLTRTHRILLGLATAALAAVALRYALHGLDWQGFRLQLKGLDWRWLGLAVVFDVASYAAQGLRWRFLLAGANFLQTTRAIYAGLFLNEIVPLRPGEAVRAWLAARDLRVSPASVVPSMAAERLMDGVWLAVALLAALAFAPLPPVLVRTAWVVVALVAALTGLVLALGRSRLSFLKRVVSGLGNLRALAASGAFLLSQGLAFWSVTRASHLGLGLYAAFIVMVVVRVGTLIPGAPANLGTHQFSTVLGLSLYGVSHVAAAGFSLVVFVVLTAPLIALGLAACLNAGLTLKGLGHIATPVSLSHRAKR
jgi:glycosyltransferase 2 family protein